MPMLSLDEVLAAVRQLPPEDQRHLRAALTPLLGPEPDDLAATSPGAPPPPRATRSRVTPKAQGPDGRRWRDGYTGLASPGSWMERTFCRRPLPGAGGAAIRPLSLKEDAVVELARTVPPSLAPGRGATGGPHCPAMLRKEARDDRVAAGEGL
jgi:hypothetical protein